MVPENEHVLLVAPPFMRLVGSHNERIPLELAYLQAHLERAGIRTTLLNADATGASVYRSWSQLFHHSHHLEAAAHGDSPLISETIERILSHEPTVVVVAAADGVTPWVDLGNPYVASHLSVALRGANLYTVGVGPFFYKPATYQRFLAAFDAVLGGVASPTVVDIVSARPEGFVVGAPPDLDVLPCLDAVPIGGRDDVVMTAFGCPLSCAFCLARPLRYRPIALERVVEDVRRRRSPEIDFGDSIFGLSPRRLDELASQLAGIGGRSYSCEMSVRLATAERLATLKRMGVTRVKLGVESGSPRQLRAWGKRQTTAQTVAAAEAIKEAGLELTVYVLLGGTDASLDDAWATLHLCRSLPADDFVVNVLSYMPAEDQEFHHHAHFSAALVREYRLEPIIDEFFALQADVKPGLGELVA